MISYPFSLRQLQYATAVAETGGFRKAARLCHVSQPSLSAQIAQLEAALGVHIFERGQRRVLVTTAGAEVLARSRQVLIGADDLVSHSACLRDPFCGTLRIAVIPTVSPYLLPDIMPAIRSRYPRLSLRWSEEKTPSALQSLREGSVDAALLARVSEMDDVDAEVVAEDRFVLAGARSQPLLRQRRAARLEELEGATLLLLDDGHCLRDQTLALCERLGVREAAYRATSLATLAQMTAGGAGVTLLPELSLSVENRHADLAVRPFAKPQPKRTLVLAWRRQSPLAAALRELAVTMANAPALAARNSGRTARRADAGHRS